LKRPPTQDEFGQRFFQTYKNMGKQWERLFHNDWVRWGTEARARRTYPSFVREYHVEYVLEKVFGAGCVDRGHALDYSGVDFVVKVGRDWFPVRTYVDTKRSAAYAKDKASNRHAGRLGDYCFDLRLPLHDAHRVGQFKLYSLEQAESLRDQIHETQRDTFSER
jgi:hypothetical protein